MVENVLTGPYDMVVFTAPSGAGKTTIVRHLLEKYNSKLAFSISATTRDKRPNEVDGKDYYFLSEEEFKVLIDEDQFVEWEEVYAGGYYGTLKSEVEKLVGAGKKLLFDIDVYGAQSIKQKYGSRALAVFVKPPSFSTLVQRLQDRKTENPDSLKKRVKRIKKELLFEHSFDYVLLNDELETTLEEVEKLIETYLI